MRDIWGSWPRVFMFSITANGVNSSHPVSMASYEHLLSYLEANKQWTRIFECTAVINTIITREISQENPGV